MNNVIIIPSLNPGNGLIKLVNELKEIGLKNIIVVDDGSKDKEIFKKLDVVVLTHDVNRGKGAAIKTAVSLSSKYFKNIMGFVTCDCDGQHTPSDIKKISDNLNNNIVLGVRDFNGKNVPFRSKFGNKFSSIFFYFATGKKVSDTQTGLRGISIKYKDLLLNSEGDRFEYEMNFLMNAAKKNIDMDLIPIRTIYLNENKGSNFKAIKDSYLIYRDLFVYAMAGFLSFIVEIILFNIFCLIFSIFLSAVFTRMISGVFNFIIDKKIVFKSNKSNTFIKYIGLFICIMLTSAFFTSVISSLGLNKTFVKIGVDLFLCAISYLIQKRYIFRGNNE